MLRPGLAGSLEFACHHLYHPAEPEDAQQVIWGEELRHGHCAGQYSEEAFDGRRQALRLAETSSDALSRFETTWNLAQLGMYAGDAQAVVYAHQALRLARELERSDLLARGWNVLAHVHSLSYHWNEVEQAATQALSINQSLDDRAMQAENLALLSQAQVNTGSVAEGLASARRAGPRRGD